jgi:hypothetical protein
MRYELRITAYDALDHILIRGVCDETPDDPDATTVRVWERTATSRRRGSETATEWIREVLDTLQAGL